MLLMKTLPDIYQHYRKNVNKDLKVDRRIYYKVVDLYLLFFVEALYSGVRVSIPMMLGSFIYKGRKRDISLDEEGRITGVPIDWGSTLKLWKENENAAKNKQLVYHFNDHTDGHVYTLRWSYKMSQGRYKLLYCFSPCRMVKRTFAKLIKQGKEYETDITKA